jgi:hypothetical protein
MVAPAVPGRACKLPEERGVGRDNAGKAEKRPKAGRQSYQLIVPAKRVNKRGEGRGWRAANAFHGNTELTGEGKKWEQEWKE